MYNGTSWHCPRHGSALFGALQLRSRVPHPKSYPPTLGASIDVAAGGSVVFTINATVSGAASGQLDNIAMISAPIDPDGTNNSSTDTDNLNPTADLVITKTDGLTVFNALAEAVAITGNTRDIYVASRLDNGIGFFQRVTAPIAANFGELSFKAAVINGLDGVAGLSQVSVARIAGAAREEVG